MSTLIADRFEVLDPDGPLGRDRVTGARVLLAESWPGRWRGPVGALDVATLRAMAERVARMNHQRVAQVLSVDPVVIEAGPERDSQPALSHDEWLRIADELASTIEELFAHGVSVDPMLAWVERTPEGQAHVRLPAPVHAWDVARARPTRLRRALGGGAGRLAEARTQGHVPIGAPAGRGGRSTAHGHDGLRPRHPSRRGGAR